MTDTMLDREIVTGVVPFEPQAGKVRASKADTILDDKAEAAE